MEGLPKVKVLPALEKVMTAASVPHKLQSSPVFLKRPSVERKRVGKRVGLLLAIEVLAIVFGGWSTLVGDGDWGNVPATVPVIIFSLVYHDLTPIVCAYLRGDLQRIRALVVLGSVVPLLALLVWDALALGLSAHVDQVSDLVELLLRYFDLLTIW
ncbi:hypothetical protein HYC85_007369 [Camellia sinensis]|uniref:Uncharacterized protein n=1 Tax=Camellia sinensis TaxID=4442 RepID=A0A7J7HNR3_CAMSI|nr:hypothetical protein HYC85_007369 [Camellia sinensis]